MAPKTCIILQMRLGREIDHAGSLTRASVLELN